MSGSERTARRWSREYRTLLIQEEVTSLEQIVDLGNLELLALRLPELVGAPLSLNALREDLGVSHDAVRRWVAVLERLYAVVRLSPFGAPAIRAIKKAQKHYLFDWTQVPELPQRFENLVAMALLKWVHQQQDAEGRDVELRYFRDLDGREVDFVVTERRVPVLLVEAKWGRHRGRPQSALPEAALPRCRRVAAQRNRNQGRAHPRRHPPGPRPTPAQPARMTVGASSVSVTICCSGTRSPRSAAASRSRRSGLPRSRAA